MDPAEKDDIYTFLNIVEEHERYGQIEWDTFIQSLEKQYASPNETHENPVQIMTMHKSKGLEFDSVFLPQLHKSPRADEPELLYWLERSASNSLNHASDAPVSEFILSPLSKNKDQDDRLSSCISNQKKRKQEFENVRVLYVACTRAKKRLYLTGLLSADNSQEQINIKEPSQRSMLGKIWPTVSTEFITCLLYTSDAADD